MGTSRHFHGYIVSSSIVRTTQNTRHVRTLVQSRPEASDVTKPHDERFISRSAYWVRSIGFRIREVHVPPSPPVTITQACKCQASDHQSTTLQNYPDQAGVTRAYCKSARRDHWVSNPERSRAYFLNTHPSSSSHSAHLRVRHMAICDSFGSILCGVRCPHAK